MTNIQIHSVMENKSGISIREVLNHWNFPCLNELTTLYDRLENQGVYLKDNIVPLKYIEETDLRTIYSPDRIYSILMNAKKHENKILKDLPFGDSEYMGIWFLRQTGDQWHVVLNDIIHQEEEEELVTGLTLPEFLDIIQYQPDKVLQLPTLTQRYQHMKHTLIGIGHQIEILMIADAIKDGALPTAEVKVWDIVKECADATAKTMRWESTRQAKARQCIDQLSKSHDRERIHCSLCDMFSDYIDTPINYKEVFKGL